MEVRGHSVDERPEVIRGGNYVLNIVSKESLLADRVVGFKHWGQASYGQQALDMIAAFGDDIGRELLDQRLEREDCRNAFDALLELSASQQPVTETVLHGILDQLRAR